MTSHLQTLTLPVQPRATPHPATINQREQWKQESEFFTQTLTVRHGIRKLQLDHDAGTLTIHYDPHQFSLDQVKALGREMGVIVGGAVYHTILDLPQCGRRAALALELERRLQNLPGVAHVAINPLSRTLTIEYLEDAPLTHFDLLQQLRAWGYQVREWSASADWWEKNQEAVYTAICGLALFIGWVLEHYTTAPAWIWIVCYLVAYLTGGGFAARNGLLALRQRQIDVDFLMVSAALGAALIGDWVEGGILLFLFSLSHALEHYAMDRTRQAIRALMDLRPATARVKRGDTVAEIVVEKLALGDVVEVRPGEKLPADGTVVNGSSAVDQSPITGESIPVTRVAGDAVFAGSLNGQGALEVRVTKRAQDSTLARIILLVEEAQSERAPTQRRLDAYEQRYAVGVISLATGVAVGLPLLFGWTWADAFYKSMMLLVVASPCALVISTPASILSAIAAGARYGVLFKGGAHVENLAGIKAIAFDKTGTLTVGRPRVTELISLTEQSPEDLLQLAAAVEAKSEHPLARAVLTAAQERGLTWLDADNLQAIPGKGVTAQVNGKPVYLGTAEHLRLNQVVLSPEHVQRAEALEAHGQTVIYLGTERLLGFIAVADTVRPEARAAVSALKALGVQKVVMLTGDNHVAANAIGALAGVDEVRAELLPEDKVAVVRQLLHDYGAVAMIGDGVNDAPALATATIGIAMGTGGTDVALETADIVLMSSDLSKLPYALDLSRNAIRIVQQNLIFALGVIVTLIFSAFLNVISLPIGVVGHEGSTVIVVLNGLRLLGFRPQEPR